LTVNGNRDIWMLDIARAVPSRITFDPSADWNPQWSADGSRLVFASSKPDAAHIYAKSSTGVGMDELVFRSETEIPVDWSHDGRYIVFSRLKSVGNDTWFYDMSTQKASPFVQSPFDKRRRSCHPTDDGWPIPQMIPGHTRSSCNRSPIRMSENGRSPRKAEPNPDGAATAVSCTTWRWTES
jgi:Tol biopolymer transport system component